MKVGIDVHGVIDKFPKQFSLLTNYWVHTCGHEVHILTGSPWDKAIGKLNNIAYTHHLSIVDHHASIATPMELRSNGWWMSEVAWNRTKGDYATKVGLSIHFEDTLAYAPWFPSSCMFIHVGQSRNGVFSALEDFVKLFVGKTVDTAFGISGG